MSETDVSYSCGSCAYPLNLKSSDRIDSATSSDKKSIKKGFVSFQSIDPSRFTQEDEVNCFPYFLGRNRPKTKLLCRKCGASIGHACEDSVALCDAQSLREAYLVEKENLAIILKHYLSVC